MSEPVAEPADDRVRFTVASDPMMGLAWECEPVLCRLETHFEGRIEIRHAMSVLVRDIADFVDPDDLALGLPEAIRRYLPRLPAIYLEEEPIGGMPIRMDGLALFDEHRPSALPLYDAIYRRGDRTYWSELDARLRKFTATEGLPYLRAEDNRMADFGEPPIVVNYFYHEQVKKSARGDLPFR